MYVFLDELPILFSIDLDFHLPQKLPKHHRTLGGVITETP